MEELWNTTDVARYLGVKPGTVSDYRHRGQIPAPARTLGERTHLWDAKTIREWNAGRPQRADGGASHPVRHDPHEWLSWGERDLYVSEWVRLSLVDVEPPDGKRFEHHVVTLKPAAIVAPLDEGAKHVGMVWRHRFAPDVWGWEIPGGLIDEGEEPETTARREALEEMGIQAGALRHLVTFEPMAGTVRCPHHVFAATDCVVGAEATEKNEGGALEWIALDSIRQRIADGEIHSSGTLVVLLHVLAFGTGKELR